MVRAWLYNTTDPSDQRTLHQHHPNVPVSIQQLASLGVLHWTTEPNAALERPSSGKMGEIRSTRGYKNYDIITVSPEKLPDYDKKIKMFFDEHLHEDEEIRFVAAGSGFFDIRDELDVCETGHSTDQHQWIRVHTFPGDMIVLPAGSFHRFTVDNGNYTKAMRLFKDAPKWEALNRNGDKANVTSARAGYLDFLAKQQSLLEDARKRSAEEEIRVHELDSQPQRNGRSYTLSAAAGALANYPHMRAVNGMLYVSGASSRCLDGTHRGVQYGDDGKTAVGFDIFEQTTAVLENIERILRSAGADLSNCVDATCFLSDMTHYAGFNAAYNQFFPEAAAGPTRTTVAVKQLPHPNLLVEIKVVAVAPQGSKQ